MARQPPDWNGLLQYRNSVEAHTLAEYCSAETNYLILPDEEIDPATFQIQEPGAYTQPEKPITWSQETLDDLDDHPF